MTNCNGSIITLHILFSKERTEHSQVKPNIKIQKSWSIHVTKGERLRMSIPMCLANGTHSSSAKITFWQSLGIKTTTEIYKVHQLSKSSTKFVKANPDWNTHWPVYNIVFFSLSLLSNLREKDEKLQLEFR